MRSVFLTLLFLFIWGNAYAETCNTTQQTCVQPGGTRTVDGESVTLPCWQYQETKKCSFPSDNNCAPLRAAGCTQSDSQCRTWVGRLCAVRDQTYQCSVKHCFASHGIVCGKETYCMDDHCSPEKPEANQDFNQAASELSAVGGGALDIKKSHGVQAFSGQSLECADDALGFKNCCAGSGWGKNIGLAHCRDSEKKLGQARQNGLAVYAGRYCHNHVLGACTSHHQVYCVFPSKLAQIVQQQGRKDQLHIAFGDVGGSHSRPNCRGMTPGELSRLNFSNMDFTPLVNDIKNHMNLPNAGDLASKIKSRIKDFYAKGDSHE